MLERFYAIREELWDLESIATPHAGRDLRGLLHAAGFSDIEAAVRHVSYGDAEAIRAFGEARASDCVDPWFSSRVMHHGLVTPTGLTDMERAWGARSASRGGFLAFPWLHVTGNKPLTDILG